MKPFRILLILAAILVAFSCIVSATNSVAESSGWIKILATPDYDLPYSAIATSDGGTMVVGSTWKSVFPFWSGWLSKLDSTGAIEWQKSYGATEFGNNLTVVRQTSDGGYVASGQSQSSLSTSEYWILKLDQSGNIEWQKSYGGNLETEASDIRQTSDGGYILCGHSAAFTSAYAWWVIKLNVTGDMVWQKLYSNPNSSGGFALSIFEMQTGGYAVLGRRHLDSSTDLAFVQLDSDGNILWQRSYDSGLHDQEFGMVPTSDGFVLAGTDLVLKINLQGDIQWAKKLEIGVRAITSAPDSGYFAVGSVHSDLTDSADIIGVKLSANGDPQWARIYGSTGDQMARAVQSAADGYIIVGINNDSNYGDLGANNVLVLRVKDDGQIDTPCEMVRDDNRSVSPASVHMQLLDFQAIDTSAVQTTPPAQQSPLDMSVTERCTPPVCLFCDDFENGVPAADWTYTGGTWSELDGTLIGNRRSGKATAIAAPAFSGCTACTFESDMMTAGGEDNQLSFLAWYSNPGNTVEVLMNEVADKWVMRQRGNGQIVAKESATRSIHPGVTYRVRVVFDGVSFHLFVGGNEILSMPNRNRYLFGTVGFRVRETTGYFGAVWIY